MNVADMIDVMQAAGCSADQVAAAARIWDERRRARAREGNKLRQRKWRNANNGVTGVTVTMSRRDTPSLKKKASPHTPLQEKTPSLFPSSANALDPPKPEKPTEIIDWFESQWNQLAKACGLGGIRAMTDKRMRAIRCRADDLVNALGFPDPRAGFTDTFNRIRGSPFLRGAGNGGRAWKVDVDWLLTESNFLKVHEGNYAQEQHGINRR